MFDWHRFLDLADDLIAQRPDDEAAQRAALSRAYYAVFALARSYLLARNRVSASRLNAHYVVWSAFAQTPRGIEQRIAQEGNRLKRRRDMADYDAQYPTVAADARRWVARARRLAADIDGLT